VTLIAAFNELDSAAETVVNVTARVQEKDAEWELQGDENCNEEDAAVLAMYGVLDDPAAAFAVVAADDKAGQEEDAAVVEADLGGDAAPVFHAMRMRSAAK
jgi:hypothetical protein